VIVAKIVVRGMNAPDLIVARIDRAIHFVVAGRGRARLTSIHGIATFRTVTERLVVAITIIRNVNASIQVVVAIILGAIDAVIAKRPRS
jgi:hypothetical protein